MVYVGSRGGIEEKLMPQANISLLAIHCGKFRRYHKTKFLNLVDPTTIFKNLIDFKNFILGIFDSFKILRAEDPDLVFLKGGYVSLPFGIACRLKRVPYFLHESDVIPGLANKLLLKRAEKIFVSYPVEHYADMPKERLVYAGNPIRKDILEGDKKKAAELFDLDKNLKTILIIGGSQGAHVINELIAEKLKDYLEDFQIIHIAGDYDFDWLEFKSKKVTNRERYKLFTFLSGDLKHAYATADLVITRAGNNVLTEVAAAKKPAIIIPLESSANDHQLANAKVYSREGAAYVMIQSHLDSGKLLRQVRSLLNDTEELNFLSGKISKFYNPDSAELIAGNLIDFYKSCSKDMLREEEASEKGHSKKSRTRKNTEK